MPKPKIALYYDLPFGGARRFLDELTQRLDDHFDFFLLPTLQPSQNRLLRDKQNFFDTYSFVKKQLSICSDMKAQAILVSHDTYFAAPAILRQKKIRTLLYCQEPTRALFEPELKLSNKYPLINRVYENLHRSIKKRLEINNAQDATKVLCNSLYSQKVIEAAYSVKPEVVYPGVDTKKFAFNQNKKKNQILIVGNDEPQKRLSLALSAVRELPPPFRPIVKIISPTRRISADLKKLARDLDVVIDQQVGISDQDLISNYQTSCLTLITALKEPFGYSAAESLSCGTPVVSVAEGGVVEIIKDSKGGFLADPSPASIKNKLERILSDKQLANEMGAAGRQFVENHFDWSISVSQVKDQLLALI